MNRHKKEKKFVKRAERLIDELEQEGFRYDDSVDGDAEKFKRLWDEFWGEILGEFAKLCERFIKKR